MKKEFTHLYMNRYKGCYSEQKLYQCSFMKNKIITIDQIMDSEIETFDKAWFFIIGCELTDDQIKEFNFLCADAVKHIYNEVYPNDNRVNELLEAIKLFDKGEITNDFFLEKRSEVGRAIVFSRNDIKFGSYAAAHAADAAYNVYVILNNSHNTPFAAIAADKYHKQENIILQLIKEFIQNN